MAIDISRERVFPLAQAPDKVGIHCRRWTTEGEGLTRRKINVATFYRWSSRGCRGTILETIQVGNTRCTSMDAIQRFFDALSHGRDHQADASPSPRTQRKAAARAEAEALALGL